MSNDYKLKLLKLVLVRHLTQQELPENPERWTRRELVDFVLHLYRDAGLKFKEEDDE